VPASKASSLATNPEKVKLHNVPVYAIENALWLPEGHILISIGEEDDSPQPKIEHLRAQGIPILSLRFSDVNADVSNQRGTYHPLSKVQAHEILAFVEGHKDAQGLIVHCAGGISRSAGIVLALSILHGWKLPAGFWAVSEPNTHITGLLLQCALGPTELQSSFDKSESIQEARRWRLPKNGVCADCKEPMKFNVPRLGPDGGFVHSETGLPQCS
jgi:predicted protein tyrosine phosphatase